LIKPGDEVEVKVVKRRNDDGYVVLSKIELQRENAYNVIKAAKENTTELKTVNTITAHQ